MNIENSDKMIHKLDPTQQLQNRQSFQLHEGSSPTPTTVGGVMAPQRCLRPDPREPVNMQHHAAKGNNVTGGTEKYGLAVTGQARAVQCSLGNVARNIVILCVGPGGAR